MPSVREYALARAKAPAKIFSMDRNGVVGDGATASASPSPVVTPIGHVGFDLTAEAEPRPAPSASAAHRPPRAPGGPGSTGFARPSDGRRRPEAATGAPTAAAARRSPSEPPIRGGAAARRGAAADNSPSRSPAGEAPRGQARASSASRCKIGETPPPVDNKNFGKVPSYLRKRQEEAAEERRRAARTPSPQPPPGFRKVADDEKQATLNTLRLRKAEIEKAQRNLPFKIETPGQKKREKDLSDRFAHIEKLLGMFSKPVVFVPEDAEPIAKTLEPLPAAEDGPGGDDGGPPAAGQRPGVVRRDPAQAGYSASSPANARAELEAIADQPAAAARVRQQLPPMPPAGYTPAQRLPGIAIPVLRQEADALL
eukprot:gnl/TRDRNA2_/TRDRNA2_161589_c3_seq2.p1 gnl/TRDRNA2_/TRDRNA2_161589_c3~~gnl/TRDRNA2_/TRDRNA2_161589_c3_seq2.p1  ORF type:complete len:386 (-),score=83.01 gnl/TRDRNA2_/TRDRNA2_161589_c3_seq2:142-1248(-)